ncbi:hypothetical protein DPMN_041156 [Dreissena polymorpha]|uniref:RAI1-like domain-containing protein n=1 Tax=Dreissena polymorpha TaxID=45954 RepID=A0A9D4CY98_DREPO|nr:hypothetical protein DPMN_041156 [Dreissena polymorpha]
MSIKRYFPSSEFKNAFVCQRQLLTNVMCTPYEKVPWKVGVIFRDDTYYMCEVDQEMKTLPDPLEEMYVRSLFWGWKMKQYLISGLNTP